MNKRKKLPILHAATRKELIERVAFDSRTSNGKRKLHTDNKKTPRIQKKTILLLFPASSEESQQIKINKN